MIKFNPGLSQILSKVFLSKNMLLELTKYCCVFTWNDNTKIAMNTAPTLSPGNKSKVFYELGSSQAAQLIK